MVGSEPGVYFYFSHDSMCVMRGYVDTSVVLSWSPKPFRRKSGRLLNVIVSDESFLCFQRPSSPQLFVSA